MSLTQQTLEKSLTAPHARGRRRHAPLVALTAVAWLLGGNGTAVPTSLAVADDSDSPAGDTPRPPQEPAGDGFRHRALSGIHLHSGEEPTNLPVPAAPRTGIRITGHCVDENGDDAAHCPVELLDRTR